MVVDVHFLGKPKVTIDGIPLEMEQKKTQAMLLYILFNGSATRDELAELLWCDYAPDKARSNLRNSLYKLKSIVGGEILMTKGHSFIKIAEGVTVRRDIDLFITENSQNQIFSLSSYIFLEHFYVKNCPEFDRWISNMRTVYEKLLVKRLTRELRDSITEKAEHRAESCAVRILAIDPYHEEACRELMRMYIMRGDYSRATAFYQQLRHRLSDDLGVAPTEETEELFRSLQKVKKRVQPDSPSSENLRGRAIVDALNWEYHNFSMGLPASHCILSGDIGMGKSQVIQDFIKDREQNEYVYLKFHQIHREVACYGAERMLEALYAWAEDNGIRLSMPKNGAGSLNYFKVLDDFFSMLHRTGRRLLLVMQNLEAVDPASMDVFLACLFELKPENLLIVGEYCFNFEEGYRLPGKLFTSPYFRILEFPLLDERDSAAYLREKLEPEYDQDDILKEGCQCTGGNLLLLREYARNVNDGNHRPYTLSSEGREMIDSLLASLSADERQLLELLAVLELAEIEALAEIMQTPSVRVLRLLDSLFQRGWLRETEEGPHLLLQIRFPMIREMICDQMTRYKLTELHRLAAKYYEEKHSQNPKDPFCLARLRSHCRYIGSPGKEIYYNILYLEYILDYFDEFFPTIVDDTIQHLERWLISRPEAFRLLEQYSSDLRAMENELPHDRYCELQMRMDYMWGRSMIRSGQREEAIVYIRKLIETARSAGRTDMLLKGYIEALCYCLRAENPYLMRQYVDEAHAIDGFEQYERERGIILRLEGYLAIMNQNYDLADQLLRCSISLFEQPKLRRTNYYDIAGDYYYLALSCRRRGRLDEALSYIHKSTDLCLEQNVQKSLDLFYEECGCILFLKGDYSTAEQYFRESIEFYEQFDNFWLRSVAESGLAMIYADRGSSDLAVEHFCRAEVFSKKEKAKEELECLEKARQTLKKCGILPGTPKENAVSRRIPEPAKPRTKRGLPE